jgi:hypothetical protein
MSVGLVTPSSPLVSSKGFSATVGKAADGTVIDVSQAVVTFRANEALSPGDVVCVVAPTASQVPSVHKVPAVVTNKATGVVLNTAAAGDAVRIATDIGWCKVGTATSLVDGRSVSVDGSTAGTVADSGAASAYVATDIGISRSAVISNFYGSTSAILVEFM